MIAHNPWNRQATALRLDSNPTTCRAIFLGHHRMKALHGISMLSKNIAGVSHFAHTSISLWFHSSMIKPVNKYGFRMLTGMNNYIIRQRRIEEVAHNYAWLRRHRKAHIEYSKQVYVGHRYQTPLMTQFSAKLISLSFIMRMVWA